MEGHQKTAWIVYDANKTGSMNQCLALCEGLGYTPVIKEVKLGFFHRLFSPFFRIGLGHKNWKGGELPPSLVIASGRQASGGAARLRSPTTKVIFIMNPYISTRHFDAVIAPMHDHLVGENVCSILGGLHNVTKDRLESAKKSMPVDLPKPHITVLLGGDSQHFTYTESHLKNLRDKLFNLKSSMGGGSFLITPSRRTRPDLMPYIHELFKESVHTIWDVQGENPYLSFLAHADVIVATSDSISMVSEACGVGVPVLIEDLSIPHKKFKSFFHDIFSKGYAEKLADAHSGIHYPQVKVLNELEKVIAFVKTRLGI